MTQNSILYDPMVAHEPQKYLGSGAFGTERGRIAEVDGLEVVEDGLSQCDISLLNLTTDREGHMAWNETTREKYKRSLDRYESDLSDEEWRVIKPLLPAPSKLGRPAASTFDRFSMRSSICWRQDVSGVRFPNVFRRLRRSRTTSTRGATTVFWNA